MFYCEAGGGLTVIARPRSGRGDPDPYGISKREAEDALWEISAKTGLRVLAVNLLIRCVDHPAAAGQTFLVSDGEDLSTPDLLRHMAAAMGRSARLFPVPVSLLRLAGSALGKRAEIDRLVGSLQIDSSHTRQVLGWAPPVSVQEGIRRMVLGSSGVG